MEANNLLKKGRKDMTTENDARNRVKILKIKTDGVNLAFLYIKDGDQIYKYDLQEIITTFDNRRDGLVEIGRFLNDDLYAKVDYRIVQVSYEGENPVFFLDDLLASEPGDPKRKKYLEDITKERIDIENLTSQLRTLILHSEAGVLDETDPRVVKIITDVIDVFGCLS